MWRLKKPWLCVANDGCPLTPICLILADSQDTGPEDGALAGLDLPLFIFRPGLAQPPPGTGDGLRDNDIGVAGVPRFGEIQGED